MKIFGKASLVIVALAVGAVAGYFAAAGRQRSALQSAYSQLEEARTRSESLASENRQLAASLAKSAAPQSSGNQPATEPRTRGELTAVDKLKVLVEFQQEKMVRPALTFFDREGKLNDSFASLFALTPDERARLERSVQDARQKLAELEHSNSKLSRDEKGNFVVAVQPFPAEGGKVYDEVMQAFSNVLGPDRNDAFRKIGAEQFEITLGRFGAAERTYTFGYDLSERPGQPYTFQDKVQQRSPGGGLSGNTNNTRFRTYEELAARVGPIISILPPDFKRAK